MVAPQKAILERVRLNPWDVFKNIQIPSFIPRDCLSESGSELWPWNHHFYNSIAGGPETAAIETTPWNGKVQFSTVWRQVDGFYLRFRIGGLLPDAVTESLHTVFREIRMPVIYRLV